MFLHVFAATVADARFVVETVVERTLQEHESWTRVSQTVLVLPTHNLTSISTIQYGPYFANNVHVCVLRTFNRFFKDLAREQVVLLRTICA